MVNSMSKFSVDLDTDSLLSETTITYSEYVIDITKENKTLSLKYQIIEQDEEKLLNWVKNYTDPTLVVERDVKNTLIDYLESTGKVDYVNRDVLNV